MASSSADRVRVAQQIRLNLLAAFTEAAMVEHASLVVWTKAQMRGVRSLLLRTKKAAS